MKLEDDNIGFKDFIQSNQLIDIQTSNGTYTWTNKRRGIHNIASRLDRFLISDNVIHLGGDFHASILPQGGSDHWPIMLQWTRPGKHCNRPFRFEAFWSTHPDFKEVVRAAWKSFTPPAGAKMFQFQQKLRHLKQVLKVWNKTQFGNILETRKKLEQNMCSLQHTIILEGRIEELADKEHSLCQGERLEKHEDIEKEFKEYFQEALKEQTGSRSAAIRSVTQHIPKIITKDHNQNLLKPVSMQEVEEAMAQLKDGKAPGPDGFTSNFFHEFWELISTEVWELVEESRSMHWLLPSLNSTFIALVPKGEESNTPDKFRPIALCNVIYKLISKVVANRLKPLLPLLILPEQTGYVEGRQIMDGIILSKEVIHSLKILKKPSMIMKLDLSKAFDKLSWEYIHQMLLAFGFNATWTRWIMNLITSPCFSVLLNGSPSLPFRPSRGIRQGDPLSPFIFVLMAEGLSRLLHHVVSSQAIKGIALHGLHPLSHQQFVDDTMLFGHPSSLEAKAFKALLSLFSEGSGTSINANKSQLFFFNTPVSTQRNIARILGFSIAVLPSKYLGALLMVSALKHASWRTLLDKLEARLSSWTYRSLNIASRLILIKSVLQAMPLYLFSILAAPKWVLKAIRNLQRSFLWGSTGLNRKWALVKWTEVCQPKSNGGLGLRDPLQSNCTMGARIWWNWLVKPHIPWAKLWQAKYAPGSHWDELIKISPSISGSMIWNAAKIHSAFIQENSFWEIHSGNSVRFWEDSWQQLPKLASIFHKPLWQNYMQHTNLINVSQFWQQQALQDFQQWKPASSWQTDWHGETFTEIEQELSHRKIKHSNQQDKLRWGYTTKGTFTTKEAYILRYAHGLTDKDQLWNHIWQSRLWPKVSTFLWLLSKKHILTWDNLQRRGFIGPSRCPNCTLQAETILHLMETCPLATQLWEKIDQRNKRVGNRQGDIANTLRTWPKQPYQSPILNSLWNLIPGFLYWILWKERNNRVFNNSRRPVEILWLLLKQNLQETLALRSWQETDWPNSPQEQLIRNSWNLNLSNAPPDTSSPTPKSVSPLHWSPPAIASFKLNFDGAAKGNPGPTGYGGVIRNDRGVVQYIFYGSIGKDTNNVAELEGLWKGICIVDQHSFYPLEVEGDSLILINAATRIQAGTSAAKIASSWRLLSRLETLEERLRRPNCIIFKHVRRTANQVADRLANQGVDLQRPPYSGTLNDSEDIKLQQECHSLVLQDIQSSAVGEH
eukprot:PITA_23386